MNDRTATGPRSACPDSGDAAAHARSAGSSSSLRYLLITPARNEETFLELVMESVINQTVRPLRWLIVSDGSTDRTDEIVTRYAAQHPWIELYRMPERQTRDFGGKARCFNTGYKYLSGSTGASPSGSESGSTGNSPGAPLQSTTRNPKLETQTSEFDVVVSLDADITFQPDYFEFLLGRLAADPKLGIVGTPFVEGGASYDYRFSSSQHVSGACQVFRRECLADIGGYIESKGGGIDVAAVLTARLKGWETRTFTERTCEHHRPMGSANYRHKIVANFRLGYRQYCLGFHPLWQTVRSVYQMARKPYIVGGVGVFTGYFWAMLRRVDRPIGPELVAFQRQDQMRRLRKFLHLGGKSAAPEDRRGWTVGGGRTATAHLENK